MRDGAQHCACEPQEPLARMSSETRLHSYTLSPFYVLCLLHDPRVESIDVEMIKR
jgi:hypothetical protein